MRCLFAPHQNALAGRVFRRSPSASFNVLVTPTLEDAREFVPDEGHELLYDVHGVRLPAAIRKAILELGFPAWG